MARVARRLAGLALVVLATASVAAASDLVILVGGDRRVGTLQSCLAEQCRVDGRTLLRSEIAWIGLGSSEGDPPAAVDPASDEIHLAAGGVLTGPIVGVSLGEVATEAESHERGAVRWIHFGVAAGGVWLPPGCRDLTPASAAHLASPTTGRAVPERPIAPDQQLAVFDELVRTIETHYVDRTFNGRDWPALVAERRARLGEGVESDEFYALAKELVSALGDEHSHLEAPREVEASQAELAGARRVVGVGMLLQALPEKGRATVLLVNPGSSAEHAGLLPHDSVLAADGAPLVDGDRLDLARLLGFECSRVTLTVRSPGGEPRELGLVRHGVTGGTPVPSRLLPMGDGARVGYMFLPTFFDLPLVDQVRHALSGWGPLDGLILDNRMNGGGSSNVIEPLLRLFTQGTVGHFVSRAARRPLVVRADPIHNSQTVPLVVLVGEKTASFGEIFSGVLRDGGRARLVGKTTKGNVETLHGYGLADGSRLWIAQETFDPAVSHADWEEEGIRPDVAAYADWDSFSADADPVVAAAVALLGHH